MTSRRLSFTLPEKHFFQQLASTTPEAVDYLLVWFTESKIGREKLLAAIENLKLYAPEGHPVGAPKYKPSPAVCELLGQMQHLAPGLSLNMLIRGLVRCKMDKEYANTSVLAHKFTGETETVPRLTPPTEAVTIAKRPACDHLLMRKRRPLLIFLLISMITTMPLAITVIDLRKEAKAAKEEIINVNLLKDNEISRLKIQIAEIEQQKNFIKNQAEVVNLERDFLIVQLSENGKPAEKSTEDLKSRILSQVVLKKWDLLPLETRLAINIECMQLYDLATR